MNDLIYLIAIAEILVISVSVVAIVVVVAVFICLKIDEIKKKRLAKQKKRERCDETGELNDGGWSVKEIEDNFEAKEKGKSKVDYDKNTRVICNEGKNLNEVKTEKEKTIDNIVTKVMQENEKREEKEKAKEDTRGKTKELLEKNSALSKIIKEKWKKEKEKERKASDWEVLKIPMVIKKTNSLKWKDVTIKTNGERLKLILEGIDLGIVKLPEFEKYVISSLQDLTKNGTSRPANKERLRKILKMAGTMIINPPEREQYVATYALGNFPRKR